MSRLRVPLLISRFLPFSVLLGTLIAFAGLNQHSEVVAMKAAGMSAHQILAPLIVASLGDRRAGLRLQRDGGGQVGAHGRPPGTTIDYKPIPPDERHPVQCLAAATATTWSAPGQVVGQGPRLRARRT